MPEKILVVDNDIDSLKLIGLMLQRQGYEIMVAQGGQQALQKAAEVHPDLIVLDVMLSDIDGYEVCRRLRAHPATKETPILIFTARGMVDDKVAGFEAGADDYLTKPTHPAELASRVRAVLDRVKMRRQQATARDQDQTAAKLETLDQFAQFIAENVSESETVPVQTTLTPDTIFVSYTRTDWDSFVKPLVKKLQESKVPYWVDQYLIEGGSDWLDEINSALRTCERMILCVSPESLASRFVRMEYRYFFIRGKKIYPLICREADLSAELETIQYYGYAHLNRLIQQLTR